MEKIMIYPYTNDCHSIIENYDLLINKEISAVVPLKGWNYIKSAVDIINPKPYIEFDFLTALNKSDIVWIVDTLLEIDFDEYILPQLKMAYVHNRKIYISRVISNEQKEKIINIDKMQNNNITFIGSDDLDNADTKFIMNQTPVLAVAGIVPNCDKFHIQLLAKKAFERLGYSVLWVGSKKECELFGGHAIPNYMFSDQVSETRKIKSFNAYLTKLENYLNPDVILLGIPGCIMTFDTKYFDDFGILAYELHQSITIDKFIMSSPYLMNADKEIQQIIDRIQAVFNIPIISYNLAKTALDPMFMLEMGKPSYVSLTEDFITNEISRLNHPLVTNLSNYENVTECVSSFISEFS